MDRRTGAKRYLLYSPQLFVGIAADYGFRLHLGEAAPTGWHLTRAERSIGDHDRADAARISDGADSYLLVGAGASRRPRWCPAHPCFLLVPHHTERKTPACRSERSLSFLNREISLRQAHGYRVPCRGDRRHRLQGFLHGSNLRANLQDALRAVVAT